MKNIFFRMGFFGIPGYMNIPVSIRLWGRGYLLRVPKTQNLTALDGVSEDTIILLMRTEVHTGQYDLL